MSATVYSPSMDWCPYNENRKCVCKYVRKLGNTTHTSPKRYKRSKVLKTEKAIGCQQQIQTEGEENWKGLVGYARRDAGGRWKMKRRGRGRGNKGREKKKKKGKDGGGRGTIREKSKHKVTWPTCTITRFLRQTALLPFYRAQCHWCLKASTILGLFMDSGL